MQAESINQELSLEEISRLIESNHLSDWLAAVKAAKITGRQLAYMARRIAEIEPKSSLRPTVVEILQVMLVHPYYTVPMCQTLAASSWAAIMRELAKSSRSDAVSLRTIFQRNWQSYKLAYAYGQRHDLDDDVKEIMTALASNPQTPDDVLWMLVQSPLGYWWTITKRPYCDRRILDYVLRYFEELPDYYLRREQIIAHVNRNGCADDQIRERVAALRNFDNLVERVQDQSLSEAELIRIARVCAGTDKYPRPVRQIANSLVWHTNATTAVMRELVKAPHSFIDYLVARSDLADEAILMTLSRRVHRLEIINRAFYDATVKEILHNPQLTNAVILELLKTPSLTIWQHVAMASQADRSVLQTLADVMAKTLRNQSEDCQKFENLDLQDVIGDMMAHPNGGKPMYQYLRSAFQVSSYHPTVSYAAAIVENAWRYVVDDQWKWHGNQADKFKTDPSIVKLESWPAVHYYFQYDNLAAEQIEDALQCEWLCAQTLDNLVYNFAFRNQRYYVWRDGLDECLADSDNPRYRARFKQCRTTLCHLIDHPLLTEASRAVLLHMDNACGEYLREYTNEHLS